MFSDFHSDFLTACGGDLTATYYNNNIITAVFRGKRSFSEAYEISKKARLLAYEEAGYPDLYVDKLIVSAPLYVGLTWNGENTGSRCRGTASSKSLRAAAYPPRYR